MLPVRSLKPNVTREEAIQYFSRGTMSLVRETMFGPLCSVAPCFVPFQLFRVEIRNGGRSEQHIFGLDAVLGSLDLYRFEHLPAEGEVVRVETRNHVPVTLEEKNGKYLVLEKVRRFLFSTGFFRIRDLHLSAEAVPGELYVPYWVGFRGRETTARLFVMDAVRRRMEGAKVKQLLQGWLTSPQ